MAGHVFEPTVLREYDIRGVVDAGLTTADANAIGRAFGTRVRGEGGSHVCVGYDGRLSSPGFEAALVDGLTAAGMDVSRIGLGPTPMLYYSVYHQDADGGVMITGSHNPPDQNGFKFMLGKGPFYGDDIAGLGRIAATGDYAEGEGVATDVPMFEAYVARIAGDFIPGRDLKVAWDAGNGAAGEIMARLTARLAERGGVLRLATRARELIMQDGAAVGVVAQCDGAVESILGRATVIADGGFQANMELMRRFISPRPESLLQRGAATGRGDGLTMAQAAGARLIGMAKPMPRLLGLSLTIAVLIPMTSPRRLSSGPPELPGLIAASV